LKNAARQDTFPDFRSGLAALSAWNEAALFLSEAAV